MGKCGLLGCISLCDDRSLVWSRLDHLRLGYFRLGYFRCRLWSFWLRHRRHNGGAFWQPGGHLVSNALGIEIFSSRTNSLVQIGKLTPSIIGSMTSSIELKRGLSAPGLGLFDSLFCLSEGLFCKPNFVTECIGVACLSSSLICNFTCLFSLGCGFFGCLEIGLSFG